MSDSGFVSLGVGLAGDTSSGSLRRVLKDTIV
jgi:hypothetical protein